MTSPTIGTFIRPVGPYLYCLEVMRVIQANEEGPEQWWCRRWGISPDKQRPVDDGHLDGMHYLNGLRLLRDGCWKDEWEFSSQRWYCVPLYWRRMDFAGHQEGLF